MNARFIAVVACLVIGLLVEMGSIALYSVHSIKHKDDVSLLIKIVFLVIILTNPIFIFKVLIPFVYKKYKE